MSVEYDQNSLLDKDKENWENNFPVNVEDSQTIEKIKKNIYWRFQYMQNNFQGLHFSVWDLETDQDIVDYYNETFVDRNLLERQCEEWLVLAQEKSSNYKTVVPKRQMYAALVVTRLIWADEKMQQRCRFIMEHYKDNLAAKYLSPVDGFLYLQAVSENFGGSNVTPMEQMKSIYMPFRIISEWAKTDGDVCVKIWLWLIYIFEDYLQYGTEKDKSRVLREDVVAGLESAGLLRTVARSMANTPEIFEKIFGKTDQNKTADQNKITNKNETADQNKKENPIAELERLLEIYVYAKAHGGDQVQDVEFNWNLDKGLEMADHVDSYQNNERNKDWRKKISSNKFNWTIK